MRYIYSTLGKLTSEQLGMILPHEHVFVDLRTPDQPGYGQADTASVLALMVPQIEAIKALGVTALVECSTGGVGRRADLDLAVISHDRGWYDPALPNGGVPKPYTVVSTELIPLLMAKGVSENTVLQLFHRNPFEAFSRP